MLGRDENEGIDAPHGLHERQRLNGTVISDGSVLLQSGATGVIP